MASEAESKTGAEQKTLTHAEWLALPHEDHEAATDTLQTAHEATPATGVPAVSAYDDAAFKQTIRRALRMLLIITLVAAPLVWWRAGWQSAVLLLVGAGISGSGLWEWLKLMSAVMVCMDADASVKPRPIGGVLAGFFVRLALTLAVLYGSLKLLDGSVYALAAGLGLGVFTLLVEGIRLVRSGSI